MLFDPLRRRETAMIDFLINTEYDSERPMGNVALSSINMLIGDWIVGLKSETEAILPSRIEWMQIAIDSDENFKGLYESATFHKYNLYKYLALAKWLHTGVDSQVAWQHARVIFADNYVSGDWYGKRKFRTNALDDYLALCIQAKNYQAGIDEFEKYHRQIIISLKRKRITPREYGYLVCQNKLNPVYDDATMIELGRKMLVANLEDHPWLGYGQYSTAAMWLKIVYWCHKKNLTPEQNLLQCYENMPNVPKPDFIS
jgi:hypothetical protein